MKKKNFNKQTETLEMEMMTPRVMITEKQLKDIKDWEVGKTYEVEMKLKQISKHEMMKGIEGMFEVVKIMYNEDKDES